MIGFNIKIKIMIHLNLGIYDGDVELIKFFTLNELCEYLKELVLVENKQANIDKKQKETDSRSERFDCIRKDTKIAEREKKSATFEITRKEGDLRDIEQKINWTEKRIKEVAKPVGSESSRKIRIERATSELAKYKGFVSWQENRSRQANTVIKRNK